MWRTLFKLDPSQWLWLLPLYFGSGILRLALLSLPFRWIAPLLGRQSGNKRICSIANREQQAFAIKTGYLVRGVCKYTPWESQCLVQAILASLVLQFHRIPHVTFLGVDYKTESVSLLQAHAWVCAGNVFVTGGDGFKHFTVVSSFTSMTKQPTTEQWRVYKSHKRPSKIK